MTANSSSAGADAVSSRSLEHRGEDDEKFTDSRWSTPSRVDDSTDDASSSDSISNLSNASLINLSNKKKKKKEKEKKEKDEELPAVSQSFSLSSSLYKFNECLAEYNRLYKDTHPYLMMESTKFYIETEKNGVGHLDLLFASFCNFAKMEKLKNLPMEGGEKVFCWLGKRKAMEVLPTLRPDHHFVNRLPFDVYLKDKQSMAFTLRSHVMQRDSSFPPHFCPYLNCYVELQLLCRHQYQQHNFLGCAEESCWEAMKREAKQRHKTEKLHIGDPCQCFNNSLFVPETHVFNSSLQQNVFVDEMRYHAPEAQWMVKPSYLRGGRGVRIFANVEQLRKFLKIDPNTRHMWGQDYVVQRYINSPMLTMQNHKFDFRMFLLIVVCRFHRVLGFLHPGFVRKAAAAYSPVTEEAGYKAKSHLVSTRVWQKYAPKPNEQTEAQTKKAAAMKKPADKKKGLKMARDLVPIVGFFEKNFNYDECEEYNFAVRHGCLKDKGLPLMQTGLKMPQPGVPKKPPMYRQRPGDPAPPVHNDPFLQALDTIVQSVCSSISKQVKEKSNCYQIFSLDMCIDENSKPWLLEVNPSIITENVNWESDTIKEIIPAIFVESLGLVFECTKKSLNFMPLRTPKDDGTKPEDLVLRQNFIWCYSSPITQCRLFEMKAEKYAIEKAYKYDLTSKGISYQPVDYFPERNVNMPAVKKSDSSNSLPARPRFPTPVADVPVLEEDVNWSYRYKRESVNYIKRQTLVRRMQARARRRQKVNERRRYRRFQLERQKARQMPRQRFDIGN